LLAVLPTFVHSANHATRATLEALEQDRDIGPRLLNPGIRQCIDLNYATASHQTIWEYSPKSRAADDYNKLVDFVEDSGASSGYATPERLASAPPFRAGAAQEIQTKV
jgi:cellulose biosynthesis protein BcsQ